VLSWTETARRFRTSWDVVFRAVAHAVRWGLEHRNLDGIRSIGVDQLSWKKGQKYLIRDKFLLSEDMSFAARWRDTGGKVWLYIGDGSPIAHHGRTSFQRKIEDLGFTRAA
jgi:hypothetical protein